MLAVSCFRYTVTPDKKLRQAFGSGLLCVMSAVYERKN
ncbi:MAG: hypothetical protein RI984_1284 [Pseudomonadota bacterium]|jgi:hypothetical protein